MDICLMLSIPDKMHCKSEYVDSSCSYCSEYSSSVDYISLVIIIIIMIIL